MFGIKTLPATFNKLISRVLGDLDNVCTYVDDIIIHTDTFESHLIVLRQVFQRLEKAKLMVKPSKVSLCKSSVFFLGFILDDKGVSPDPAKIAALVNADPPRTPKQVRQFLGAAGFMRAFIPHFSQIARPLHALTKKDHKFEWTHDCEDAFDLLKRRLTEAPVLRYPAPHFPSLRTLPKLALVPFSPRIFLMERILFYISVEFSIKQRKIIRSPNLNF